MKKAIGIVMIVLGALMVIPNMISFIKLVSKFTYTANANNAYEWGFFSGKAIGVFVWMAINIFLFVYGIRLVRKPVDKNSDNQSFEDSFHSNTNP